MPILTHIADYKWLVFGLVGVGSMKMEHAQHLSAEAPKRFGRENIIASMQVRICSLQCAIHYMLFKSFEEILHCWPLSLTA